jgi:hypothetical protein
VTRTKQDIPAISAGIWRNLGFLANFRHFSANFFTILTKNQTFFGDHVRTLNFMLASNIPANRSVHCSPAAKRGHKPFLPLDTPKDMAAVFQQGASKLTRTMSRTAAVGALRRLGFGKSAAYAALSPDGRFSGWLACAPDGIISWTEWKRVEN